MLFPVVTPPLSVLPLFNTKLNPPLEEFLFLCILHFTMSLSIFTGLRPLPVKFLLDVLLKKSPEVVKFIASKPTNSGLCQGYTIILQEGFCPFTTLFILALALFRLLFEN